MADTANHQSQHAQSQQSTPTNQSNPNRNRRRRPPRRPREDPQASAESLGNGLSEGQTATEVSSNPINTHSGHHRSEGAPSSSNRGGRRGGRGGPRQNPRPEARTEEQGATRETTEPSTRGTTARQRARRGGSFVPGARQFGGQLTKNEPQEDRDDADPSTLHAEAPNFVPGQSTNIPNTIVVESGPSATSRPRRNRERHRGAPKTVREAEDLTTRIHTEISSGEYECMICYSSVNRKSKVWDCTRCYAVFHLHCIKKWAKQALEVPGPSNDEIVPQRTWRCPGCQNTSIDAPNTYTCWCGKSENPEVARYVPPHSCGQTCGRPREGVSKNCPHGCDLQCHAGPCPPCSAMGPVQPCFCGKETSQKRCLDTDYENGWTCGHVCGDFMPCGEHMCERECHGGVCGACEVKELLKCYCGQEEKEIRCCDKLDPMLAHGIVDGVATSWEGYWKCERKCERAFDCGEHKCQKGCHAQDIEVPHCPFSPDVVSFCPCGKTELGKKNIRTKCTDPIPHCDKEVTCNTSSKNQSPRRPEIKCIDDCRRRQLAAAFNIDIEKKAAEEAINTYSDETLEFYMENKAWCVGIEKMAREFCEDKGKIRLAFKPMKSHLRGFIHGLAEDYGLDSESQDPEPYRSVVMTKNTRWSMPSVGLADAVRARKAEAAAASAAQPSGIVPVGTGVQQLRKTTGMQAVNAILLSGLRVGLLTNELEKELNPVLKQSMLRFGIRWYGDEEVLLEPLPSSFSMDEVEVELGNVRTNVRRHCTVNRIASSVDLCWVGRDGKVSNKEGQGWSVVSTGKGTRSNAAQQGQSGGSYANLFGVLRDGPSGSFAAVSAGPKGGLTMKSDVAKAKVKVLSPVLPKEEPVDDWLEAMENEEREAEAEKAAASGAASSVEDNSEQQSTDEAEIEPVSKVQEEATASTTA
ncbi:hypothetical protein H072_1501 [Dactylellina haptotyla CBS 200.50]|uniref:R3H domain-containing protein n=1 Tax=Dactylellina haptotyla (strain CBS 200.50) TaxID=1284197 RepID=S8CA12_DACHA|nr:hypothetical protein H072_1501 [Dactylellina haptotyla CBS 200.50]